MKLNKNKTPIIYITRDIERALGIEPQRDYYIISNTTPLAEEKNCDNTLLHEGKILDTWKLLDEQKVKKFIDSFDSPQLVVFKNTKQIQRKCEQNNWHLLNPSPELINTVEQKISQIEWMGDKTGLMPKFEVKKCKEINFDSDPFIIQFNRAHTGSGTHLIGSQKELGLLQQKFPDRPAKVSEYIKGDMFTLNCVVSKNNILTSSPSYQITGLKPFTANNFATVGNDWGLAKQELTQKDKSRIKQIGREIGQKLRKDNFLGLFGIDVIKSDSGDIYLIEINARQPASTTFESKLQAKVKNDQITTFKAHLHALLNQEIQRKIEPVNSGAQIIYRNKNSQTINVKQAKEKLEEVGFEIIVYNNQKPNTELFRIMSEKSFFKQPGILNPIGQKITNILYKVRNNN